ncbi:MAG: amidase [Acidimicrobiales bacterium]
MGDGAGGATGRSGAAAPSWLSRLSGPLSAAAAGVAAGEVTSTSLVSDALAAVAARDDELHAVVDLDADAALAEAVELDAERRDGRWRGPLHGVPMTVKDVIDVAGFLTRAGSDAYVDRPAEDAAAVGRLRRAGAVVIGKVSTHEFALGVTSPQSRNPHDPTRLPGGSSGGSAIAVATGMGLASLGTDTRASIRVPAALSGVVGLKATFGRVPTEGWCRCRGRWTTSPRWRRPSPTPAWCSRSSPGSSRARWSRPRRWVTSPGCGSACRRRPSTMPPRRWTPRCDPHWRRWRRSAPTSSTWLARLPPTSLASAAGLFVSRCEAAAFHRSLGLDRSRYWAEVDDQLREAATVTAVDYLDAQRARTVLATDMARVLESVDLLAMPTSPVVAPPAEDYAEYLMLLARNAIPWSFVGFPALSLPCGWVAIDHDGAAAGPRLPVGLQLVAPPDREDLLLRVAIALEAALAGAGS